MTAPKRKKQPKKSSKKKTTTVWLVNKSGEITTEEVSEQPKIERRGIKHLAECNCILPQYKNRTDPLFHKFIVFSIIDENDKVEEKFVECNNCGIVHHITEIGKSSVIRRENARAMRTQEEIAFGFPENIAGLLEAHHSDLATYEEVEFILDNQRWGYFVVLTTENMEEHTQGKILTFKGPSLVKIEAFQRQDTIQI